MKASKFILVTAVMLALSAVAQATPVTVANYSFESPVTGSYICFPSIEQQGGAGWTFINWYRTDQWSCGIETMAVDYLDPSATDGTQVGFSNGGAMYQTLGATVLAGDKITLTVDIGRTSVSGESQDPSRVYQVALYFDNPPVFGDESNIIAQESDIMGTIDMEGWKTVTVTYTAAASDAGKNIGIFLSGNWTQVVFDNVHMDVTPTPEPATMSLLALGGIGLLIRRKHN